MRLLRRILVVLGVAGVPAVVASFGCNVDNSRYPGLPNELPNIPGVPLQVTGSSSSGGTGGSSSSSSGGTGGSTSSNPPAQDVCGAAEGLANAQTGSACQSCESNKCSNEATSCNTTPCGAATCCSAAAQCVNACASADGDCIGKCIAMFPAYQTLVQCLFTNCAAECAPVSAVSGCALPDAGTPDADTPDADMSDADMSDGGDGGDGG